MNTRPPQITVQVDGAEVLTVSGLIKLLQSFPPEEPVFHEGCDCWGAASGVEQAKDCVLITRHA